MRLENMLEEAAEGKPSKEQIAAQRRQQAVFDKIFGKRDQNKSGYADPALMFK